MWHSFYLEYELTSDVHDDLVFAYLITQELQKMGIKEPAKRLKVFDGNNNEIAYSNNFSEIAQLKYTKQ